MDPQDQKCCQSYQRRREALEKKQRMEQEAMQQEIDSMFEQLIGSFYSDEFDGNFEDWRKWAKQQRVALRKRQHQELEALKESALRRCQRSSFHTIFIGFSTPSILFSSSTRSSMSQQVCIAKTKQKQCEHFGDSAFPPSLTKNNQPQAQNTQNTQNTKSNSRHCQVLQHRLSHLYVMALDHFTMIE